MSEAEAFTYRPIGIIHSPHTDPEATPVQGAFARGVRGVVEVFPPYAAGLKDLEGFSHVYLLYHFHLSCGFSLLVKPFLDVVERGLFSTRAPRRPNAIGLSIVALKGIEGRTLHVEDVDILDGTPLLDIKPYIKRFDEVRNPRCGWHEGIDEETAARCGGRK